MKHPFVKSVLLLSTALALLNCGDEAVSTVPVPFPGQEATNPSPNSPIVSGSSATDVVVSEPCWILNADQLYVITTKLEVFNAAGVKVGGYDPSTSTITDASGSVVMEGVNYLELPLVDPASYNVSSSSNGSQPSPTSSANNPQTQPVVKSSSSVANPTSSSNVAPKSSSSVTPKSSSSQVQQGGDGTCFDKVSNKNVKPYESLSGKNGEAYAYKEDCSLACYYDPANKNCASIGTGSNNNQQQPASSSSVAKSSSSVAKSSSSVARSSSSSVNNGGTSSGGGTISSNYTIKYVSGGKSGSGFATRYWDCCKPHCAWPGKGGKQAHACDARGNIISDDGAKSMCDGGNSGTCVSQVPIIVNDNIAFAFAAVPGSAGGECGKCFALEFTGKGKYETKNNHKALAGKTLIVIASNIGYDVAEGQFDIMIPGGGFGIFDGCSAKMGWGDQGERYGGLLSQCESEVGYSGDIAAKRKECLVNKCNKSFSGDAKAKEGCLFLATWMEAAGNPLHNFREVECPQELLSKF